MVITNNNIIYIVDQNIRLMKIVFLQCTTINADKVQDQTSVWSGLDWWLFIDFKKTDLLERDCHLPWKKTGVL